MYDNVSFFGKRMFVPIKFEKLYDTVENLIKSGSHTFWIGTHGQFDELALAVCRSLRKKYDYVKIIVVFTSQRIMKKDRFGYSILDNYTDVITTTFPIEDFHYKRQIIESNKLMIDRSDIIICCVDINDTYSGARRAYMYAKKKGKHIINLFPNK